MTSNICFMRSILRWLGEYYFLPYYFTNFLVSDRMNFAGLLIASTLTLGLAHAPLEQVVSTG